MNILQRKNKNSYCLARLIAFTALVTWQGASAASELLVDTQNGPVQGAYSDRDSNVRVFKGIPFAAPPIGDLRWRAPVPHASWESPRNALEFGSPCWQPYITGIYSRGPVPRSEDCLYLNVWTAAEPGERQPVMVWIHGGALVLGHGHLEWYAGSDAARDGIVKVSLNYRLGPLGFFAHPWLEGEDANGNQGLLDQIAALRWVQENIEDFGGDPNNVTIFGESAGSASVCYLQAAPAAKGLFHKAIGESAGCFAPHPSLEEDSPTGAPSGYRVGRSMVEVLAAGSLEELRGLDAESMWSALEAANWSAPYPPVYVDGNLFPAQMRELYASGLGSRTPVLVGANEDEETALFSEMPDLTHDELLESLHTEWQEQSESMIAAYAQEIEASPRAARDRILSHRVFAWDMRTWAELAVQAGQPAYLYHFVHEPDLPEYGKSLGAFHAAEIPYVFGNLDVTDWNIDETDRKVSRLLSAYWRNFARHGDPNGEGLVDWPRFSPERGETMELGAEPRVIEHHLKKKLDVMSAFFDARSGSDSTR